MTETGASDVHGCVVMVAARLQGRVNQISTAIRTAIEDNIAELRGDAEMLDLLAGSVLANAETIFRVLQGDMPAGPIAAPGPTLEYARRTAQHGIPANVLVRALRLGQRQMTEAVFGELRAVDMNPAMRVAVIEAITTEVLEYLESVSQQVVAEYEGERERWLANQDSVRATQVREVLTGAAPVDADATSKAIRYPLHGQHLALIIWYPPARGTGEQLPRLHQFTRDLAAGLGTSTDPLFIAADRASAWVWLPFESSPGEVVAAIRGYVRTRPEAPNIAMGAVGSSIDGFRRSHHQAQRVRAAVSATGVEPAVAAATDSAMLMAGQLTSVAEVRDWVADVLGGLATEDGEAATLRETLRIYLQTGGTHEQAARELDVTFDELKRRVARAVARRGRPIDDRHDVELALRACQWYGAAVLRPN